MTADKISSLMGDVKSALEEAEAISRWNETLRRVLTMVVLQHGGRIDVDVQLNDEAIKKMGRLAIGSGCIEII